MELKNNLSSIIIIKNERTKKKFSKFKNLLIKVYSDLIKLFQIDFRIDIIFLRILDFYNMKMNTLTNQRYRVR